jgi:hypothetical protein
MSAFHLILCISKIGLFGIKLLRHGTKVGHIGKGRRYLLAFAVRWGNGLFFWFEEFRNSGQLNFITAFAAELIVWQKLRFTLRASQ